MKNKILTKKAAIVAAIIIVAVVFIGWSYQSYRNTIQESPNTIILNQGTQAHFETLSIGLSSVDNDSAWLSIRKDGEADSTTRQVVAGDTVDIYGYRIEIRSVNKGYNFSFKPGASNGNVKLVVDKQ